MVAEGVETEAQLQALRVAGCSHLQGYFFSRPVAQDVARGIAEARYMADPSEIYDAAEDAEAGSGTGG